MKTLFLSLLFISTSVFAATNPESISVICAGRLIGAGGPKTAPFVIKASTPGVLVNPPWAMAAGWQGENAIVDKGVACGITLAADKTCLETRVGADIFELTQTCGPVLTGTGFPHSQYISSVVLDGDHGYFNCTSDGQSPSQHIELTGCQLN